MEFITYSSKLSETELLQYNIFISPQAEIKDGVKLYFGVKVYGNSWIGADVELHSNTEICDSNVGRGSKIFSSVINACNIGVNCIVKPFTHLNNSDIAENSHIGNFTSISNSSVGANSHICSLCSINNMQAGINLNILSGACCEVEDGTTVNIGDNVIVGANATIIKSVIISDEVEIEPGSVITKDIDVGKVAGNGLKQIAK